MLLRPSILLSVLFVFSLYSIAGCAMEGGAQRSAIPPVPPVRTFTHSSATVFPAVEKVLHNQGYAVTSTDRTGGSLTAELFTSSPLQEDAAAPDTTAKKGMSTGEVILVVLSIVLIVGLIFIIIDAATSDSGNTQKSDHDRNGGREEHRDHDRPSGGHHDHDVPGKTVGYRYVMNVRTIAVNDTTTRVETALTKVTIVDGTPTSSVPVQSSAAVKIFFESLANELYFVSK